MVLSLFLAKVLGLYLVVVSLAALLRRRETIALIDSLTNQRWFFYWTGAVSLLLGLALVISHNVWVADYRGVITVLGWLTLAKGLARLLWAEQMLTWTRQFIKQPIYPLLLVVSLVVGLWLAYTGFYS